MTVKQKFTTAALKRFLIAPRDPLIAHTSLDIKEMDITVQVLFEVVWSVRSALFRNVFVAFSFFLLLFIFFAGFSPFISCETSCFSMSVDFKKIPKWFHIR